MTEKGSKNVDRVSLDKTALAAEPAATPAPPRPRQATWVVAGMLLSGVLALLGSLSLYGLHSFIIRQLTTANAKLKGSAHRTKPELLHAAHQQPTVASIQSLIFLVVLVVVVRAVWRGRYWSRWAVVGVWFLASVTGIFGGATQILYIVQSAPLALKVPVALSSLSFTVAAGMVVFSRPLVAWLNLTRPARPAAGAVPVRRGLFAPREPLRPTAGAEDRSVGDTVPERARAKQRVNPADVQRVAVEPGARGRGSKSRRSGS